MKGRAYVPARKNLNEDFPLRGSIACECGNSLTAGWTKGRNKRYPYYYCQNKACGHYGKSIKRDKLEGEFEALLKRLTPKAELISIVGKMFDKVWVHRAQSQQERQAVLASEKAQIERKINQLLDRIIEAETPTVARAYEKKIKELEELKIIMSEKIENCGHPVRDRAGAYRTTLEFIKKPFNLWKLGRFEDKRAVIKLAFTDRLTWVRNEGYRTAHLSLPFKHLSAESGLLFSDGGPCRT